MPLLQKKQSVEELLKTLDQAFESAENRGLSQSVPLLNNGVAVIIVVYKSGKILFEAIETVLNEGLVEQLILIDNGSNEKDTQKLRDLQFTDSRIQLVQGHGNIGFGRAANVGAILATQPYLIFLNPDAILQKGAVRQLRDCLRGANRPAIVGARVLNPDGSEQRGARRGEITPFTTFVTLSRIGKFIPALKKFDMHWENKPLPEEPIAVPTISGACFAALRSDFIALKGFDTRFFLHVEDVDLCWRARKAGGEVVFLPTATVVHEGHTSRVDPVFVEWNKGMGLNYYFRKRAKGIWRKAYVLLFSPLVLGISVGRALLRRRLKDESEG